MRNCVISRHEGSLAMPSSAPMTAAAAVKDPNYTKAMRKHGLGQRKRKGKKRWCPRARGSVVVIHPVSGKTYTGVLGVIPKHFRPEETEIEIRQIRKTQSGAILLELKRCKEQRALQSSTEEAQRPAANVWAIVPRT